MERETSLRTNIRITARKTKAAAIGEAGCGEPETGVAATATAKKKKKKRRRRKGEREEKKRRRRMIGGKKKKNKMWKRRRGEGDVGNEREREEARRM